MVFSSMKNLNKLISIAKIDIQINYHELFGETAEQVINRNFGEYGKHWNKMIDEQTIIRLQANLKDAQHEYVVYHWDLSKAISEILKLISNEKN